MMDEAGIPEGYGVWCEDLRVGRCEQHDWHPFDANDVYDWSVLYCRTCWLWVETDDEAAIQRVQADLLARGVVSHV